MVTPLVTERSDKVVQSFGVLVQLLWFCPDCLLATVHLEAHVGLDLRGVDLSLAGFLNSIASLGDKSP
eukprot:4416628-Pyramimonas_sp.AAC.1